MSPTVELYVVPVIIPLKLNFLLPDVSKNKLNEARYSQFKTETKLRTPTEQRYKPLQLLMI